MAYRIVDVWQITGSTQRNVCLAFNTSDMGTWDSLLCLESLALSSVLDSLFGSACWSVILLLLLLLLELPLKSSFSSCPVDSTAEAKCRKGS